MSQLNLFVDANNSPYEKFFLDESHFFEKFNQVDLFKLGSDDFDFLWKEHPDKFHEVVIHGKLVKTPRWQQAYGKNYEYTGSKNNALPISDIHKKYISWCKTKINPKLNGLLINWYDGKEKHYIGKHRDSTKGLLRESPVVTITHGEERVFRFRPWQGKGYSDFLVKNGDVIVIPWNTNQNYTHEVPHHSKYNRKRISVTLRAYD